MNDRTCSTARCLNSTAVPAKLGGGRWCHACAAHWKRHGKDPAGRQQLQPVPDGCVVEEDGVRCGRAVAVKSRGWCASHQKAAQRHGGDPTARRFTWGAMLELLTQAAEATGPECFIPAGWEGQRPPAIRFRGESVTATRAVWTIAHGAPPAGHMLHRCNGGSGSHGCIALGHLYEGDDQQNSRDKLEAERQARGERQGHAVLTEAEVRSIKRRHVPGQRGRTGSGNVSALAEEYGVHRSTIKAIIQGRSWGWLTPEEVPVGEVT